MAIIITWAPTGQPATTLTINDTAQASLEAYRLSIPGPPASILTMLLDVLRPVLLVPAFGSCPPADVESKQVAAAAAQQEAQQAMQEFITSAITATGE